MKKHLSVIFFVTLFVIFFTGQIDYKLPEYSGSDLNKYIAMAEVSPDVNLNIIRPFVYRILAPWFAGLMPFSLPVNFFVLNFIFLISLSFVFYFLLLEFNLLPNTALLLTIAFQMNRYFFQFLSWNYFQLCDTIALFVLFLSFILIKRKKFLLLFLFLPASILVKEYALIIVPAGIFYFYKRKEKNNLFAYLAVSLVIIGVYLLVRFLIVTNEGADLLTQYTTKEIYTSRIMLFLKKYIASFTPFGLLPFVFYKKTYTFFKNNFYLLVYTITVIVISYFGEAERMMAPLAPVYYLFVGALIENFLPEAENKFRNKFFIAILLFTFLSSFYHLWGIVKLPGKYWTMSLTVVITLATTVLFYFESKKVNRTIEHSI